VAFAIDASSPAWVKGTTNPATTASFTPPANACILVFTEADESNTFVVTNSGGLTLTQQNTVGVSARNSLSSWIGYSGSSPSAMTVTSTKTGSFTAHSLRVLVITGTELSFTGAHNVAQSNTITLTMTQTGSWGFAAFGDNLGATTDTAGTGCTWHDAESAFGGVSGGLLKRTTADGVSSAGTTMAAGSTASDCSIVMVEIKAPSAGGTPAVPVFQMSQYGSFH
jgi:hypothetical protein